MEPSKKLNEGLRIQNVALENAFDYVFVHLAVQAITSRLFKENRLMCVFTFHELL